MTHQHLHVPDGYLFAAFVNSPVAVAVTRDGAFIDVNDAFTQLLGWQPFDHKFRIVRPDGETRWIWDRGFPVVLDGATIRHFVGVAQDVTHRREREEQLRERTGYRILHATNASEALDLWPSNETRVNLLVTDMVLPSGPSGREVAARLRERRPDLKVLLVSGHTTDFSGKEVRQQPGHYFLQKPFSPTVFVETVRECLNSPGYGGQA